MQLRKKVLYGAFILSAVVSFAFIYFIYTSSVQTGITMWLLESNIKIYGAFLVIFFGLFLLLNMLGSLMTWKQETEGKNQSVVCLSKSVQILLTTIITTIGFGLFAHWGLVAQFKEVGVSNGTYYDFPMAFRVILMLIVFLWMAWMIIKDKDIEDASMWAAYITSIVVTFMCLFIVNPFSFTNSTMDFTMGIYDNTSVTETIYNVFDGVPYTYSTTGLYGHYPLFFSLPLKFSGGGIAQIIGLIALCGCLEQVATIYVINIFAPKKWTKALLALAAVVRTSYTYPAISPIRTLFPLILCAFMVFLYKNDKRVWFSKWYIIGYILCSAAVLWNTETGIGCIIGFTTYVLVELWQENKLISGRMCLSYLSCFVFAIASILFAIIVVNIYNIFCGVYQPVFRSFFYPFISSSWTTEELRCNVPLGNHAWMYILILFLGCSSWALYHTKMFHKEKCVFMREAALIAGISLLGIIVFAYYMNEAHWGCMDIIHKIATCLVALILYKLWHVMSKEKGNTGLESQLHRGIVILALLIFSLLAIQVVNDPIRISARHKAEAYNMSLLRDNIDKLATEIPEETYGIGQGINIIYHELGWDNHAKYRDTTAIHIADNNDSKEKLIEEILQQDSFLIGNYNWADIEIIEAVLSVSDSYRLEKTVNIMGCEYAYYVKEN